VSGVAGDRWRRHKEIAAVGYGVSAACRLGLLAAGASVPALAAAVACERVGKGIRTAPRDALISLSTPQSGLAHAFGVHRALDAFGAMLGPLVAVGLLMAIPRGFDVVFVVSFCFAIVGLGLLLLFVKNVTLPDAVDSNAASSWRVAIGVLCRRDFRVATMVASGLSLVTISDAFIYLTLQGRSSSLPSLFPLFYVGTSATYLMLAIPAGLLADWLGRARVFLLGHAVLLLLYVWLAAGPGRVNTVIALALLGAYYAMTDGVVAALASGMLPVSLRGSGLALLSTATSVSRLLASIAFGWLWVSAGRSTAIAVFGVALAVGLGAATLAFGSVKWTSND
jgi:MFS family permease